MLEKIKALFYAMIYNIFDNISHSQISIELFVIGFIIFSAGFVLAAHFSTFLISRKEKEMAKKQIPEGANEYSMEFINIKGARIDVFIQKITNFLMLAGLILMVAGYFFGWLKGKL